MNRRILALDPGKTNMGIAALELRGKSPICLANATLECPLDDLKRGYRDNLAMFIAEVETWVNAHQPEALIIERFQSRGLRGTTAEVVSIMIGAISTHYMHMPISLITAATWKNKFQKRVGKLDQYYKACRATPHQVDAVLMGCYGFESGLRAELTYDMPALIRQIEDTSTTKLINRRVKK